jgi:hypothetical protein
VEDGDELATQIFGRHLSPSAPSGDCRVQPDQLGQLLLMNCPARPTLAEVPSADRASTP